MRSEETTTVKKYDRTTEAGEQGQKKDGRYRYCALALDARTYNGTWDAEGRQQTAVYLCTYLCTVPRVRTGGEVL